MTALTAMTPCQLEKVEALEIELLKQEQCEIPVDHLFHAGVYARTVTLPAGAVITGARIKIPTILLINGDVDVYDGNGVLSLTGYNVLQGDAGRKTAFVARSEASMTMLFASEARSVEEAEREFTDEYDKLLSRKG